jgi:hypothetical protein
MYLRCVVHDTPTKWHAWLPLAEFCYNTTFHSALGCSPYKALYGKDPHYGTFASILETNNLDVQEWIATHQGHSEQLRQHLVRAQQKVKHNANLTGVTENYMWVIQFT